MIPRVSFQSADPGTCAGIAACASSSAGLGLSVEGTIGPIFAHVLPPSELRSIHTAQERYDSIDVPLTMMPSCSTSGFARIGPSKPAGRCSAGLQLLPSSALHLRAAAQVCGLGPNL